MRVAIAKIFLRVKSLVIFVTNAFLARPHRELSSRVLLWFTSHFLSLCLL